MYCPRPLKPARCPSLRSSAKAWAGDREERHELSVGLPGVGVWKEAEQERASPCGGMGQVQCGNEQMLPPSLSVVCLGEGWSREICSLYFTHYVFTVRAVKGEMVLAEARLAERFCLGLLV